MLLPVNEPTLKETLQQKVLASVLRQMLFTASDLASITGPIHSWVFFLLWLHPFILSGVISPLILWYIGHLPTWGIHLPVSSLSPSHTVHGVLKARILKWFAIPFSRGPHSVRLHDSSGFTK